MYVFLYIIWNKHISYTEQMVYDKELTLVNTADVHW